MKLKKMMTVFALMGVTTTSMMAAQDSVNLKFENRSSESGDMSLLVGPNFTYWKGSKKMEDTLKPLGVGSQTAIVSFGKQSVFGIDPLPQNVHKYYAPGDFSESAVIKLQPVVKDIISDNQLISFNWLTSGFDQKSAESTVKLEKALSPYLIVYTGDSLRVINRTGHVEEIPVKGGFFESRLDRALRDYIGLPYDKTVVVSNNTLGSEQFSVPLVSKSVPVSSFATREEDEKSYYEAFGTHRDNYNDNLLGASEKVEEVSFNTVREELIKALSSFKYPFNDEFNRIKDFKIIDKDLTFSNEVIEPTFSSPKLVKTDEIFSQNSELLNENDFNQTLTSAPDSKTVTNEFSFQNTKAHGGSIGVEISAELDKQFVKIQTSTSFSTNWSSSDTESHTASESRTFSIPSMNIIVLPKQKAAVCSHLSQSEYEGTYSFESEVSGPIAIYYNVVRDPKLLDEGDEHTWSSYDLGKSMDKNNNYVLGRVKKFEDISKLVQLLISKGYTFENISLNSKGKVVIKGEGEYKATGATSDFTSLVASASVYDSRSSLQMCRDAYAEISQKKDSFKLDSENKGGSVELKFFQEGLPFGTPRLMNFVIKDEKDRNCAVRLYNSGGWSDPVEYDRQKGLDVVPYTEAWEGKQPILSYDCDYQSDSDKDGYVNISAELGANTDNIKSFIDLSKEDNSFGLLRKGGDRVFELTFDPNKLPKDEPREITLKVNDTEGRGCAIREYKDGWKQPVAYGNNEIKLTPSANAWAGKTSFVAYNCDYKHENDKDGDVTMSVSLGSKDINTQKLTHNMKMLKPEPAKSFDITEFAPIANVAKIGFDKTNLPSEDTQYVTVKITDPNNNKCDVYRVAPELGSDYLKVGTGNITNTSSPVLEVLQGNRSLIAYDCYGKSNVVKTQPVKFEVTINGETVTKEVNIA